MYIINDQNSNQYGQGNENESTVKFSTDVVKPFLVDHSDAYILVTGKIVIVAGDDNTKAAVKNCHPFTRLVIHLNDEDVDTAENLDLIMNLYNLLEYSGNYANTTASMHQFKIQVQSKNTVNNRIVPHNVFVDISDSFKYKSELLGDSTEVNAGDDLNNPLSHRLCKNVKIFVPLKYISNFFRLLELPLINTKLYIELNWRKGSIITDAATNLHQNFK